jgi:glycine/D-amino acid oxidase-like deaminating enzyme/nitrite reductase/ring-hydroxylating ferredoxin subunit
LLERDRLAGIDTGHTTAHLTMVTDQRLVDLSKSLGRNHAQAVWDSGLAAIAQIETIIREQDLDCDFEWVPGYLYLDQTTASESEDQQLKQEAALANDLGFDASFVDDVPFMHRPGLLFARQARFHPRKYLAGLSRALREGGVRIFEHSAAQSFSEQPRSVTARGHTIKCDWIVLATHTPLTGNTGIVSATLFQTKLALYTSYVVAGAVKKGTIPDALFWDTADPYHYLRLLPGRDHNMVILGGKDHKTGQADDTRACYTGLEKMLVALVPDVEITHRWSGQVIETHDGLPYIGETAEHQFAATGFSGNGMTFGTLAAVMACDRIRGRSNPWSELFDIGRTKVAAGAWDYIRENKDYPYYLIRDRFVRADGRSIRAIKRGEGKVIEVNGAKAAVFRDESGKVTKRSAICTHLGCLVAWNAAERTWDCPCHGSRFKPTGEVLAGPAESALSELED